MALLGGCSLASGTQLTSKVTHEKVSLSDVASQVTKAATACDQLGSKLLTHYLKEDSAATALASPLSLAFVLAILADGARTPRPRAMMHSWGSRVRTATGPGRPSRTP